jgi:hypothetical protein
MQVRIVRPWMRIRILQHPQHFLLHLKFSLDKDKDACIDHSTVRYFNFGGTIVEDAHEKAAIPFLACSESGFHLADIFHIHISSSQCCGSGSGSVGSTCFLGLPDTDP